MKINTTKYTSLATIIFVFFTPFFGIFKVSAAALTNMSISGTGITSSSSAVSAAITPTIAFQLTQTLASSDTIQILFTGNGSNNGVTVSSAGLASADITVSGACSGTVTLSGSPIATGTDNPTLTLTGITGATGSVCNVIFAASELSTDSAAGNVSVAVSTSDGDYGAILYYIGDANDVSVTAIVPPTLSFVLRNGADTSDLSPGATSGNRVCSLGILQLATTPSPSTGVNGCQYRLRIATNATSGYSVSYISSGPDTSGGGFERLAKSATVNIANVGAGGDALTSTVGYGARLTQVSAGHTRGATFTGTATDYFRITADSATTMYSSSGPLAPGAAPDTTNTTLVEHGSRIAASQEVGNYSHVVTYTVTATF
jgi:hypothetical protein